MLRDFCEHSTAPVTACIWKRLVTFASLRLPFDHRGVIRSHDLKCTSGSFSLAVARLRQSHGSAIWPWKRAAPCGAARITAAALCGTWTFADHEARTSSSESSVESLISSAPATGRGKQLWKVLVAQNLASLLRAVKIMWSSYLVDSFDPFKYISQFDIIQLHHTAGSLEANLLGELIFEAPQKLQQEQQILGF